MRELGMGEVAAVSGGDLTPAEGAVAVFGLVAIAPVGFALGFALVVGAGLLYAGYTS